MQRSETIGALAGALSKAQGAMGAARRDAINPYFKSRYADLASIVDAIKEPLASNGLAYSQTTDISETGQVAVETILMHESGEWITATLCLTPVKPDPQGIGSAISYARRYGLQAIVGVPADDEGPASEEQAKASAMPADTDKAAAPRFHKPDNGKQPARVQPLSDEMPEAATAPEIKDWFDRRCATLKITAWGDVKLKQNAQALAVQLDKGGLKDADRKDSYEYLTGFRSGTAMNEAQLSLLNINAHRVADLHLCAVANRAPKSEAAAQATLPEA